MRAQWRGRQGSRGFTLTELVAIMGIVALLVIMAGPAVAQALQTARVRTVLAQARRIQAAFEKYYVDHVGYPAVYEIAGSGEEMYNSAFGPDGVLTEYVSLPASLARAPFVPSSYTVTTGQVVAQPTYEFVLEVRNAGPDRQYVYITPDAVTSSATAAAQPSGTLDIDNSTPQVSWESIATTGPPLSDTLEWAQTFTPTRTGQLDKVSLSLRKSGAVGNLIVEIRTTSGLEPTATVLGTGAAAPSAVSSDFGWVDVTISPAVPLTSGSLYAIWLRCPTCVADPWYDWGAGSPSYAGGVMVGYLNGELFRYDHFSDMDFLFKTYMQ